MDFVVQLPKDLYLQYFIIVVERGISMVFLITAIVNDLIERKKLEFRQFKQLDTFLY
jgi:hypothetical protein